ncbi:conserved hypothetical protein [Rhodopseudomonas palustris TIE-1]|uniref:hypothetical protein n=1 Tax=Rhodopseudomonas palustris TaxID=1076 RepID=UPI000164AB81|nr:hypothetical protein [Rhodopseudomonas palustris]ACE99240.1 conserved hypothetical protein [Rhodopseudomonas palustris TIE-1]
MIEPATIAQRLDRAALVIFLDAVEARLKVLFPDVTVRQHPGRIDVSDIIEKDIFNPPMLAVAAVRWKFDGDLDGSWNLDVEVAVYVITAETVVGTKAVPRQEVAHALSLGVLQILGDIDGHRWGLQCGISSPEKVEARPLFTSETFAKGAAYYVVTWTQGLYTLGGSPLDRPEISEPQISDFDGGPVDDSDGAPV